MAAVCLAAACQPRALTQEQLLVSKDTASDQGSVVSADAGAELPADGQVAPDGDATAGGDTSPAVDTAPEVDTAAEVVDAAAEVDAAAPCPASCDDGNPCTTDLCDNTAGCTSTPNAKTCDDGQVCTTGDVCTGGQCKGKPKVWQAVLGSKHTDHGNAVVGHSDGSVTAAGRHAGNVEDDFWLARFGSDGALVWEKQYGEPDVVESAYGLAAMANGGWLMVGVVGSSSATDGRAVRVDSTGSLLWAKDVGSAEIEEFRGVVALGDGGAVAVGKSSKSAITDLWLVRFGGDGGVAWQASLGGNAADSGAAVVSAPGGGFVAVGSTAASASTDALVIRTDSKGVQLWQKILGDNGHAEYAVAVAAAPGGGFLVVGDSNVSGGNADVALWYLGDDGQVLWSKLWGSADIELPKAVVALSDGFLVAGRAVGSDSAMANGLLARFDPLGNFVWKKVMGGAGADGLAAIAALPNGFALVGDTPKAGGNAGMWVVRTDAWGHGDCASASLCKAPCASSSACKIAWCELGNCLGASVPDGGWCMESPCLAGTCDAKKSCGSVVAVSCDDGNPCTTDGCSSSGGCSHAQTSDGTPCASGSVCKAGACVAGQ